MKHETTVYSEPKIGGGWFAKCSCGWTGRILKARGSARADGHAHEQATLAAGAGEKK